MVSLHQGNNSGLPQNLWANHDERNPCFWDSILPFRPWAFVEDHKVLYFSYLEPSAGHGHLLLLLRRQEIFSLNLTL